MEKPREKSLLVRVRAAILQRFFDKLSDATGGADFPEMYIWGRSNQTEFSHRTLLGLTADKVIYFSPGIFRRKLISLAYDHITTVNESSSLTERQIVLYFLNGGLVFYPLLNLKDTEVVTFLETLRKRISGGMRSTPVQVGGDIPEQIRKLSDLQKEGILSAEEFEAKKKELLARM
ncbi:MAG: SHOCT domain-containing protein [Proteobacteria bacterium]|nr:SHOCT domain-containing protein [Pseudomonadota bacterium]